MLASHQIDPRLVEQILDDRIGQRRVQRKQRNSKRRRGMGQHTQRGRRSRDGSNRPPGARTPARDSIAAAP